MNPSAVEQYPKKDFTTEAQSSRRKDADKTVGERAEQPQPLLAPAEVLFSVLAVRSVVSLFFAAREEFRNE